MSNWEDKNKKYKKEKQLVSQYASAKQFWSVLTLTHSVQCSSLRLSLSGSIVTDAQVNRTQTVTYNTILETI